MVDIRRFAVERTAIDGLLRLTTKAVSDDRGTVREFFRTSEFAEAAKAWKTPQFAATVIHYYRTRWGGALSLRTYADLQQLLDHKPKAKLTVPTACSASCGSAV